MIRAACVVLASCLLVPAAAGTSRALPAIALSASPARLTLLGSGQATIQLRNTGSRPLIVDVARAGFSLDLRGRPKIVPRGGVRAADSWFTVRPRRLTLAPGARTSLTVAARLPRRVEPGDHDALVLLTTRPRQAAGVAVRMRVGVLVIVRAPGSIVRRLELRELRVRRVRSTRVLELLIVNRGNVTETLQRNLVAMTLRRGGRVQARLRSDSRQLRPRTKGILQFSYRGQLRGWVTGEATISLEPGSVTRRSYRIRL